MNLMDIIIDLIQGESKIYKLIDGEERFVKGDTQVSVILNRILYGSSTLSKMIDESAEFVFSHLVDEISATTDYKKKVDRIIEILTDKNSKLFLALIYITKKIVVDRFHEKMEDFIMDTVSYYTSVELYTSDDFEGYEHDYELACADTRSTIRIFAETISAINETLNDMDLTNYNTCLVEGLKSALVSFESALNSLDINLIADNISDPYLDYCKRDLPGDE